MLISEFLKLHFNNYVTPNGLNIVCGRILINELIESSKIQIVMKKIDFLELFFLPSALFNQIENVFNIRRRNGRSIHDIQI